MQLGDKLITNRDNGTDTYPNDTIPCSGDTVVPSVSSKKVLNMMSPPPPPPPPPHDPHLMEANGRYNRKQESHSIIVFLNVVNTLTQIFLGAVAFGAFTFAGLFGYSSSFNQHVYLCVTGYVLLMSQAILSMNTHAGWAHSLKYPQKRSVHGALQILGSTLAISGSAIRFADRTNHFESAHGITAFLAMQLTVITLIGGVLNMLFPGKTNSLSFRITHTCAGALTITTAFISLCLAFSNWYRFILGDNNANLLISATVLALIGILISAFYKVFRRIRGGE